MTKSHRRTNQLSVLLTEEEYDILDTMYENMKKVYGVRNASRARIIGQLLRDAGDPYERKRKEARSLAVRLSELHSEIKAIEETRGTE